MPHTIVIFICQLALSVMPNFVTLLVVTCTHVWQEISDAQGAKTVDTFVDDVCILIGHHFAPALHQDELEHLCGATKPFQMTGQQLRSCFCVIGHLDHCLPGSVFGATHFSLFFVEDTLKHAFFLLMPAP